jgi:hypothetical protein
MPGFTNRFFESDSQESGLEGAREAEIGTKLPIPGYVRSWIAVGGRPDMPRKVGFDSV